VALDEAVSLVQRDTRHYAKRQMTWNRGHYSEDNFFNPEDALTGIKRLLDQR
jgi:tRNA A37 N6-isopentenylltransferase MiaA